MEIFFLSLEQHICRFWVITCDYRRVAGAYKLMGSTGNNKVGKTVEILPLLRC